VRAGTGDEMARLCDGYRAQEPGCHFAGCSAAGRPSTCSWVGHFISNLIASWTQPDTGFPPEVTAGR